MTVAPDEPTPRQLAALLAAFLDVEVPPDCRAGVIANLDLLLAHARTLERACPPDDQG